MVQSLQLLLAALAAGSIGSAPLQQPGARPKIEDPYQVLPLPADTAKLRQMLGDEQSTIHVSGDVLTFLYRGAGDEVQVTGGIQKPMNRIPGSDIWALQLKMDGWNKAFISYGFYDPKSFQPGMRLDFKRWRGPDAPAAPEEVEELKGTIIKRTYSSKALGEDRDIMVYLPPDAPKSGLPAFFMADGGGAEGMAKVLEPLILAGKVRPVAIIGPYSGKNHNKPGEFKFELDHRATEYLPGASRYEMHMKFFADEVPAWATKEFGISTRREDRAVFGFSNGGSFSAGAVLERPHVFGTAIPMSVGAPPNRAKPDGPLPKMHFIAGVLEPAFVAGSRKAHDQAKEWGAETTLQLYFAGHDWEMWKLAFAEYAPKIFPK